MKKVFYIILLIFISVTASAECLDPDDPNFDPFCDDLDAPIDSGVGLLIGAAAFYTIKKIRERKQNADQSGGLHL